MLFIFPVSTQPRYARRIRQHQNEGAQITVASFERDYFSKNTLPDNIKYVSLGKLSSGGYIKRIPRILKVISRLVKLSKSNDIIFIFSADILIFLSPFLPKRKVWYEIGDIRKFSPNRFINRVYELIYGITLNRVSAVFVTSVGFKDYIIAQYGLKKERIRIIENKLQKEIFSDKPHLEFSGLSKADFTIGIIGLLRYENILNFIKAYKNSSASYSIAIYGDGPLRKEIEPYVDNNKIKFYGQFKYPDDLESIYESIDLSFTMYDSEDQNVRLALPNKLYESMYFKKPILVSKGTYLEERVMADAIGFSWDQKDMDGLVAYLDSDTFINDYNSLENSFNYITKSQYLS